jgi:hypothetical protein
MFNNLKVALMDPEFHKRMIQQVAFAATIAVVSVAAKQISTVIFEEIQTHMNESKTEQEVVFPDVKGTDRH